MTRSALITGIWRDRYTPSETQRRIDEEEGAIFSADTSHLDNKRVEVYIQHVKRETDKARLCLIGHWRSGNQREAWLAKSQSEFLDDRRARIPVWLAKRIGITITIRTTVVD